MLNVVFTSRHKYVFSRCGIKNLQKSYAILNISLTLYMVVSITAPHAILQTANPPNNKNRAHHTMRPTNLLK